MNTNLYIHAFNLLPQLGPKRLLLLAEHFKNFKTAFEASEKELLRAGLPAETVRVFAEHRETLDLKEEENSLAAANIHLVSFTDPDYPKLLLEIPALPPLLYVMGKLRSEELALAVVGTRKITNYGRTVIPMLLEPLANLGITIVSGLAFGVDAAAHACAVAKGSRTIAVLGCGLDEKSMYPKEHAYLAEQIIKNGGALISEHPPGRPALKQNFVARNRIISGMSVGTLVVECALKSGALITAEHALEQNRQVYAVPGPIYSSESLGPNNLLKMGAKCVSSAEDILSDLNILPKDARLPAQQDFEAGPEEQMLLQCLSFEPITIDEMIKKTGLEAAEAGAHLVLLEMKGQIKNLGGQQYVLARRL